MRNALNNNPRVQLAVLAVLVLLSGLFFLPMFMHSRLALKDHDSVAIMARLKRGVSLESARTELDVIYRQILTASCGDQGFAYVSKPLKFG